jgi:hypothetical protein
MNWGEVTFRYGDHGMSEISTKAAITKKEKEREEIQALTMEYLRTKKITVIPYGVRVDLPKADFKMKV